MSQDAELATLLVSCPDRRGIVAALAQMLYGYGANILDSDQHTDGVAQHRLLIGQSVGGAGAGRLGSHQGAS